MEVLLDHLRDKQALVVLDNCEHLLGECAMMADALLRSAPDLRILATSRQALGIWGEQAVPVPALRLPDPAGRMPLESLTQVEAVQLFTERAGAVLPDFAITEANRDDVERICRHLDGIPLAIELAAVRLRALSVHQLADRLDDRFRLLRIGQRPVMERHQTLRAVIDWSYDLCTEQERRLWMRTAVFVGGVSLEAAEAVCAGEGIAEDEIIDLIAELVDKSILLCEEHPSGMRYRLLETVRQYAADRLRESGEVKSLRRRHRDYYRRLATETANTLFGQGNRRQTGDRPAHRRRPHRTHHDQTRLQHPHPDRHLVYQHDLLTGMLERSSARPASRSGSPRGPWRSEWRQGSVLRGSLKPRADFTGPVTNVRGQYS